MDQNNNIAQIKEALDIVQVVSNYVELKQTGKNFSGRCPFHQEKTPSFIVSPDLQRYKCFGCGASGDIFNFVQNIENLDFPETLEKLAKMAGIEIKQYSGNSTFKTIEDINYLATQYYYNELKKDKTASKYVQDRGFTKESIKTFGIGYAPRRPQLLKFLGRHAKYSKTFLLQSGLFVEKEGVVKEKFYDRIMFPIRSKRGKVIGFTGRIMPGNDWGPKYMNSPETPVFHKKDNLFGQYEARQEIRKLDIAIVCEGSTDVISAYQHGVKNIVAPLGTSLTTEQLESIKGLTNNVLFFFDSDTAGKAALVRAFKLASELKMNPYAANASPYKDIDEMLQKEHDKFVKLTEERIEAFSFILKDFITDKDINKLSEMEETRKLANSLLESVKDPITKNHYIDKLSRIANIEFQKENERKDSRANSEGQLIQFPVKFGTSSFEGVYISLLLISPQIDISKVADEVFFTSETNKKVLKLIKESKGVLSREELSRLISQDEELKNIYEDLIFNADKIITEKVPLEDQLVLCENKLKKLFFEKKQNEIRTKIALAEEVEDAVNSEKLLVELLEINKILKELK
jgi:DNA primase